MAWRWRLEGSAKLIFGDDSHRISGKTPIEDVIETMKEFVLYVGPQPPRRQLPLTLSTAPARSGTSD